MKSVFLPKDNNGNPVHAHGGQILQQDGYFYWIGENRTGRNKVSCYRSRDFINWEFRNQILTLDSKHDHHYVYTDIELEIPGVKAGIGTGCNIERPKVLYNSVTGKYVMWMHWELPNDYREARCAVAVCDTIDGDYIYLGSFNPVGYMSRDCTLFQDEDGSAYFISSSRDNYDMHIYRLSDDYLSIDRLVRILWPGQMREAPTMFKKNGLYYLLTSACTGWNPNQSTYSYAKKISGDWSPRYNLGDATTYRSQPTCVFMPNRSQENRYYYLGDRWGGNNESYFESAYVLLPLAFKENGKTELNWTEEVEL